MTKGEGGQKSQKIDERPPVVYDINFISPNLSLHFYYYRKSNRNIIHSYTVIFNWVCWIYIIYNKKASYESMSFLGTVIVWLSISECRIFAGFLQQSCILQDCSNNLAFYKVTKAAGTTYNFRCVIFWHQRLLEATV